MRETDRTCTRPLAAPGDPWDPAAVRDLVAGARVVLLGEGAHGIDDFARLGDGLFRTLATEFGFTAFVRESGFAEGLAVDAWIHGGAGEVEDVARAGITYGFLIKYGFLILCSTQIGAVAFALRRFFLRPGYIFLAPLHPFCSTFVASPSATWVPGSLSDS